MKRKCYGLASVQSTQAQVGVRLKCKVKAISAWRLNIKKVLGIAKNEAWGKLGPN